MNPGGNFDVLMNPRPEIPGDTGIAVLRWFVRDLVRQDIDAVDFDVHVSLPIGNVCAALALASTAISN
jgi:hypothetical protein